MFRKFFGPQSGEPTGGNPADHMMLLSAAEEALNGVDLDEVKEFLEGEVGRQQVRHSQPAISSPPTANRQPPDGPQQLTTTLRRCWRMRTR